LDRGFHDRIGVYTQVDHRRSHRKRSVSTSPKSTRGNSRVRWGLIVTRRPRDLSLISSVRSEVMAGNGYRHHSSCAAPSTGGLSIFVRRQARHVTQVARRAWRNMIGTALFSFEGTTLAPSSTLQRSTRRRSQVPHKPPPASAGGGEDL
jgi:hypothetical protein